MSTVPSEDQLHQEKAHRENGVMFAFRLYIYNFHHIVCYMLSLKMITLSLFSCRFVSSLYQTWLNYDRSKSWAYSTIAWWNTLYSNVRADIHQQPVNEGMPTPQVSVPQVYLQDIGVANPCLATQAQSSVHGSSQANYWYRISCHSPELVKTNKFLSTCDWILIWRSNLSCQRHK